MRVFFWFDPSFIWEKRKRDCEVYTVEDRKAKALCDFLSTLSLLLRDLLCKLWAQKTARHYTWECNNNDDDDDGTLVLKPNSRYKDEIGKMISKNKSSKDEGALSQSQSVVHPFSLLKKSHPF